MVSLVNSLNKTCCLSIRMISSYEVGFIAFAFSLTFIFFSSFAYSLIKVLVLKILILSAFVTEVFFCVDEKNDFSFLLL